VLYYFRKNLQGDVTGIYNANGNIIAQYEYTPYGAPLTITNGSGTDVSTNATHIANINPFRYRGYYYDTETGFYYLQSRYYDPVVGRFINADAFVSTGQGFVGNNMFAYCLNNPINMSDYSGDFGFILTLGSAAAWKLGFLVVGIIGTFVVAQTVVVSPPKLPSITWPRTKSHAESDSKTKDIATAIPKEETKEKTKETPKKFTYIYRRGGTNPGNLTPSERDVKMYPQTKKGLSFTLYPEPGCAMTTMEEINATGVLYAVIDGLGHVSVFPVDATLEQWHNDGPMSIWTVVLKKHVKKWKGGN